MKAEARVEDPELRGAGQFEREGFLALAGLLQRDECDALATELDGVFQFQRTRTNGRIAGVRNLLQENPRVATIASSSKLMLALEQLVGVSAFPVRALYFDKTPQANWLVPWHQDLTIAVVERKEASGFGPWSVKDGVAHVQPPVEILENMVAVRLHLDDCGAENGALRVIVGSHLHGRLNSAEIAAWATRPNQICDVVKGDVFVMRPLLLHSSAPAANPLHRRVLHIEYATVELPAGLEWYSRR